MDLEHEQRLTKVEERSKSNQHRINDLEQIAVEIHTMSKSMVVLCEQMKQTNDSVNKLKDKVDILEQEPAQKWNNATRTAFNTIIGTVAGALATGLIILIAQYIK